MPGRRVEKWNNGALREFLFIVVGLFAPSGARRPSSSPRWNANTTGASRLRQLTPFPKQSVSNKLSRSLANLATGRSVLV